MKPGDRVTFFRPHDTTHRLIGEVQSVRGDEFLVATDPSGVLVWGNLANVIEVVSKESDGEEEEETPSA